MLGSIHIGLDYNQHTLIMFVLTKLIAIQSNFSRNSAGYLKTILFPPSFSTFFISKGFEYWIPTGSMETLYYLPDLCYYNCRYSLLVHNSLSLAVISFLSLPIFTLWILASQFLLENLETHLSVPPFGLYAFPSLGITVQQLWTLCSACSLHGLAKGREEKEKI